MTVASYLAALQCPLDRTSPVASLEDDLEMSSSEDEDDVVVPETPETPIPSSPEGPVSPPPPPQIATVGNTLVPAAKPEARVAPTVTVAVDKKKKTTVSSSSAASAPSAPQLAIELEPLPDLTTEESSSEEDDTDADPDYEASVEGPASPAPVSPPRARRPKRPLRETRHYDSMYLFLKLNIYGNCYL